ncbi:MAG: hypothetical protein AB7T49_18345 [Oligoflexales bacterium]
MGLKSFRHAIPLVASVALHATIIWLLVDRPEFLIEKSASTVPVKIKIVQGNPKPKKPRTATIFTPPKMKSSPLPEAKPLPKIRSYAQLLPKGHLEFADPAGTSKSDREANRKEGFETQDNAPFADKVRHLSKLLVFGHDLANIVSVPSGLREMQKTGSARIKLSRQRSGPWTIAQATGNSYVRALLYDTIASLGSNTHALEMLSASDLDNVSISFSYRTVTQPDTTVEPIEVQVDGNRISIVETQIWIPPEWQMLAVGPGGSITLNLIGLGMYLAKPIMDNNSKPDFELEKLRMSPAFVKPIGK